MQLFYKSGFLNNLYLLKVGYLWPGTFQLLTPPQSFSWREAWTGWQSPEQCIVDKGSITAGSPLQTPELWPLDFTTGQLLLIFCLGNCSYQNWWTEQLGPCLYFAFVHYLFASPCLTFLCLLTSCAPNPNQAADFATDTAPWSYPCLCPTVSPNYFSPGLVACRVLNSDRSGILSPRYIYENKLGSFKVLSNALAHYQNSYLIRLLWGLKVLLLLCVS